MIFRKFIDIIKKVMTSRKKFWCHINCLIIVYNWSCFINITLEVQEKRRGSCNTPPPLPRVTEPLKCPVRISLRKFYKIRWIKQRDKLINKVKRQPFKKSVQQSFIKFNESDKKKSFREVLWNSMHKLKSICSWKFSKTDVIKRKQKTFKLPQKIYF